MATPGESLRRRVRRLARTLEPRLASQLLRSWRLIEQTMGDAFLTALLQEASPERIIATLAPQIEAAFGGVGQTLVGGTIDASKQFTVDLPASAKAVVGATAASRSFDILNPNIVWGLQNLQSRAVKNLSASMRETFTTVIRGGIEQGLNPRDMARKMRASVGLGPRQAGWVDNFERALREGDLSVLERRLRDRRFDRTIQRAFGPSGRGLSEAQIQKMTGAYRRRLIAWNAETYARSMALDAHRLAMKMNWQDAINQGAVRKENIWKRWDDSGDSRVRPAHALLNGEEVPMDDTFSNGDDLPGDSDFNCRCIPFYFQKPPKENALALVGQGGPRTLQPQPSPMQLQAERLAELSKERRRLRRKLARQRKRN